MPAAGVFHFIASTFFIDTSHDILKRAAEMATTQADDSDTQ